MLVNQSVRTNVLVNQCVCANMSQPISVRKHVRLVNQTVTANVLVKQSVRANMLVNQSVCANILINQSVTANVLVNQSLCADMSQPTCVRKHVSQPIRVHKPNTMSISSAIRSEQGRQKRTQCTINKMSIWSLFSSVCPLSVAVCFLKFCW